MVKKIKKKEKLKIKKLRTNLIFAKASIEEAHLIFEECREEFDTLYTTKKQKEFEKNNPDGAKKKQGNKNENTDISPDVEEQEEDLDSEEEQKSKQESEEPESEEEVEGSLRDEDIKNIFKKIALKTHPDRLGDLNEEEKEEMTELYKTAAAASKENDGGALLEIAYELGIDIDVDPQKEGEWLKEKINKLNAEIANIEHDVRWVWYHSDEDKRASLEDAIEKQTIFTKK